MLGKLLFSSTFSIFMYVICINKVNSINSTSTSVSISNLLVSPKNYSVFSLTDLTTIDTFSTPNNTSTASLFPVISSTTSTQSNTLEFISTASDSLNFSSTFVPTEAKLFNSTNATQISGNKTEKGFWKKILDQFQEMDPFDCGNDTVGNVYKVDGFFKRRNIVRGQFLQLGKVTNLTREQLENFTKLYEEVTKLELDIDHYVHCLIKKEKWSILFWRKMQRVNSDSIMYKCKGKLDELRKELYEAAINPNKTKKVLQKQSFAVTDIEGMQEQKDKAEEYLNLDQLLPPEIQAKRQKIRSFRFF